jgi:hypothetical protein
LRKHEETMWKEILLKCKDCGLYLLENKWLRHHEESLLKCQQCGLYLLMSKILRKHKTARMNFRKRKKTCNNVQGRMTCSNAPDSSHTNVPNNPRNSILDSVPNSSNTKIPDRSSIMVPGRTASTRTKEDNMFQCSSQVPRVPGWHVPGREDDLYKGSRMTSSRQRGWLVRRFQDDNFQGGIQDNSEILEKIIWKHWIYYSAL